METAWGHNSVNKVKLQRALVTDRNLPGPDGLSPVLKVLGRPMRDGLPSLQLAGLADRQEIWRQARKAKEERAAKQKRSHDRRARDLPELEEGTEVVVQDPLTHKWDQRGTVEGQLHDRDYKVLVDRVRQRRSRIFLIELKMPSGPSFIPPPPGGVGKGDVDS